MPNIKPLSTQLLPVDGASSLIRHVPRTKDKKVEITTQIPAEEGTVILGKVLNEKKRYNRMERVSGRNLVLSKGKQYLFVLGNRSATDGYVGHVPPKVEVGDTLQVLNLGGIVGECRSANVKHVGNPLNVRMLGAMVVNGKPVNIADFSPLKPMKKLEKPIPIILVYGSSMNSGKTGVARRIIKLLTQQGKKIGACKVTGAGCMKDTLSMEKAGAKRIYDLADVGLASTVTKRDTVGAAKGIINKLSTYKLDFIVAEVGDGLVGEYHGSKVVYDAEFQKHVRCSVACARDLAGAWGIKTLVQRHHGTLDLFSGPVTDNQAGSEYIRDHWNVAAYNAKYDRDLFDATILKTLKIKRKK